MYFNQAQDELYQIKLPQFNEKLTSEECIRLACAVGLKGVGNVKRNPLVGAILVDSQHRFLEWGSHLRYGEDHAEAMILKNLKARGCEEKIKNATLYCTLEPCSYHGKTPSCAEALKSLPIKQVFFGQKDPNPKVDGRGLKILEEAGIPCIQDPLFEIKSSSLIEVFKCNMQKKRPFVALKVAATLDGKVAINNRGRTWITGQRAREYGHWLRQYYDGIVIGADTLILDNPSLTVRHSKINKLNHPIRVVLDPNGRALSSMPLEKINLFHDKDIKNLWVMSESSLVHCSNLIQKSTKLANVEFMSLPYQKQVGFNLDRLLKNLWDKDISSLLLEGGRGVWESFLSSDLVEKIHYFQAPTLWGNSVGQSLSLEVFSESKRLINLQRVILEDDCLTEGNLRKEKF